MSDSERVSELFLDEGDQSRRKVSIAEEDKEKPGVGKYITGKTHEGERSKQHEGVVVKDLGKTWQVVDPGPDYEYQEGRLFPTPVAPNYDVREVEKDGAKVIGINPDKDGHVRDIIDQLNGNSK